MANLFKSSLWYVACVGVVCGCLMTSARETDREIYKILTACQIILTLSFQIPNEPTPGPSSNFIFANITLKLMNSAHTNTTSRGFNCRVVLVWS